MELARSTYYDEPESQPIGEARLVEQIKEVCTEWPAYGYRRVTAELHGEGRIVNHKKVMRLMKENGLTVRPRRRFIATTDSNHDGPIFPNLAKNIVPTNLNQLWVADITYIVIASGFVYLAAILDAWSRRVVGYAIGKRIDARLALAALRAAIAVRRPPAGCIHHSDRGSQYAAEDYRAELTKHGLKGSMGRRGNPYDNAKAESFMKTLKVEEVYLMEYETFDDVAASCRASSKRSIMPSVATWRSDTKVLLNLKRNTPGRSLFERPQSCPPQGVHSRSASNFDEG
jgi:putative transposase